MHTRNILGMKHVALSGLCLAPGPLRTLSCTWLSQDSVFHLALSGLSLAPGSLRTLSCTWLSQDSVLHLALSGLCLDPLVFIWHASVVSNIYCKTMYFEYTITIYVHWMFLTLISMEHGWVCSRPRAGIKIASLPIGALNALKLCLLYSHVIQCKLKICTAN